MLSVFLKAANTCVSPAFPTACPWVPLVLLPSNFFFFCDIWGFSCSINLLLFVLSAAHVVKRCFVSSWKGRSYLYLFISQFLLINLPVPGFHAVYSTPQPFLCPSFCFPLSLEKRKSYFHQSEKTTGGKKKHPQTRMQDEFCKPSCSISALCLSPLFRQRALQRRGSFPVFVQVLSRLGPWYSWVP